MILDASEFLKISRATLGSGTFSRKIAIFLNNRETMMFNKQQCSPIVRLGSEKYTIARKSTKVH